MLLMGPNPRIINVGGAGVPLKAGIFWEPELDELADGPGY
jgi:hypothetical protein